MRSLSLLLKANFSLKKHTSSFKFLSMWTLHDNCEKFIAKCSSDPIIGCPMHVLNMKLQFLNHSLKTYKRDIFENIHVMVWISSDKLSTIQYHSSIILVQQDLEQALAKEERFWLEKSKVKWNLEGDKTLHSSRAVKIKKSKNTIIVLRIKVSLFMILEIRKGMQFLNWLTIYVLQMLLKTCLWLMNWLWLSGLNMNYNFIYLWD